MGGEHEDMHPLDVTGEPVPVVTWGLGDGLTIYALIDGTYRLGFVGRSRSGNVAVGEIETSPDYLRGIAEAMLAFTFAERERAS